MSLIQCSECGKEFSDKAPACPNCGCPTSEIVASKAPAAEAAVSYAIKTLDDFVVYAEEEYAKIEQYRVLRDEISKSFEEVKQEYNATVEQRNQYHSVATKAFQALEAAEEEYKQACQGFLKDKSKKAKEAKVREDEARKAYEAADNDAEYVRLRARVKELDEILYGPFGEFQKKFKKLGAEYPLHTLAWVKESAQTGRDATPEEFTKALYSNYVKSELKRYVEEVGTIDIRSFESITGFTNVYAEAFALTRDEEYHFTDYHDTKLFCKGKNPSQQQEEPVVLGHFSPYSGLADALSPKEKKASVIGRAIAGGLLAGPAGAVVGALSAVDKNNRK